MIRRTKGYIRLLVFAIIIISFENCSPGREKNKFSGNWYACGKSGLYIELIIKDSLFKYSANDGRITKWGKFKMEGDTMISFDSYSYEDSLVLYKAKITFVDSDKIIFDYTTSNEHWTFYRIEEAINDVDNDDKLLQGTRERSEEIKCPDMRTSEEKKEDSLRIIKFQF